MLTVYLSDEERADILSILEEKRTIFLDMIDQNDNVTFYKDLHTNFRHPYVSLFNSYLYF